MSDIAGRVILWWSATGAELGRPWLVYTHEGLMVRARRVALRCESETHYDAAGLPWLGGGPRGVILAERGATVRMLEDDTAEVVTDGDRD